jgi:hypothetical protein
MRYGIHVAFTPWRSKPSTERRHSVARTAGYFSFAHKHFQKNGFIPVLTLFVTGITR